MCKGTIQLWKDTVFSLTSLNRFFFSTAACSAGKMHWSWFHTHLFGFSHFRLLCRLGEYVLLHLYCFILFPSLFRGSCFTFCSLLRLVNLVHLLLRWRRQCMVFFHAVNTNRTQQCFFSCHSDSLVTPSTISPSATPHNAENTTSVFSNQRKPPNWVFYHFQMALKVAPPPCPHLCGSLTMFSSPKSMPHLSCLIMWLASRVRFTLIRLHIGQCQWVLAITEVLLPQDRQHFKMAISASETHNPHKVLPGSGHKCIGWSSSFPHHQSLLRNCLGECETATGLMGYINSTPRGGGGSIHINWQQETIPGSECHCTLV